MTTQMRTGLRALVNEYKNVLTSKPSEQTMQDFLEQHSELIPLEWMLGHGLHFDMVISKLRINTTLTCDFAYLTKNTGRWYIVLIELEKPSKRIFLEDRKQVHFGAEFNDALGQIESWRSQLRRESAEVKRKLNPLMIHMSGNPISFKFILVYGRDSEIGGNEERRHRFDDKSDHDIRVLTYDSLVRRLVEESFSSEPKNIFTVSRRHFKLKHLRYEKTQVFGWLSRDILEVGPQEIGRLIAAGLDMEAWQNGDLLSCSVAGYQASTMRKAEEMATRAARGTPKR